VYIRVLEQSECSTELYLLAFIAFRDIQVVMKCPQNVQQCIQCQETMKVPNLANTVWFKDADVNLNCVMKAKKKKKKLVDKNSELVHSMNFH
jgi:hypothetical protein